MVFVSLVSKTSKDIDAAEAQQEGVENIGPGITLLLAIDSMLFRN